MKKCLIILTLFTVLAVLFTGCEGGTIQPIPATPPAPGILQQGNFQLLVSDEANAINDFAHLYVTISSIGVHQTFTTGNQTDNESDDSGRWSQFTPAVTEIDLKPLQGDNATALWSGNITPGKYDKVFIYISGVRGILAGASGNQTVDIKLPSNKLQISKPFTVNADGTANFVYDITVIKTGNGTYILKPQIAESGADKQYKEVKQGRDDDREKDKGGERERQQNRLLIQFSGNTTPGATSNVTVTDNGTPVVGATVTVNGQQIGVTGTGGRILVTLPNGKGEVKIRATFQNKSGELEIRLDRQPGEHEWFEGTITALTSGAPNSSPWTMTIAGVTGPVTVYVTKLDGTPTVGVKAQIEGILTGNSIQNAEADMFKSKGNSDNNKGKSEEQGKGKN